VRTTIPVCDNGITRSKSEKITLKLKLEAGKAGGSNRSRVLNTSRVSDRSCGSDGNTVIIIIIFWPTSTKPQAWKLN